jgi:hypothetical protein
VTETASNRRLLLVAYHFGPGCATGGLRWNAMARDLAARGWELDVLTLARDLGNGRPPTEPYEPHAGVHVFPVRRPTQIDALWDRILRLKQAVGSALVPKHVASRREGLEPERVQPSVRAGSSGVYAKLMLNLNALMTVSGDAVWAWRAHRLGRRLIERHRHRVAVVSTPPHVTQAVGIALARRREVLYLPDFRDPWIFGRPKTFQGNAVTRFVGSQLERRALASASVAICNTERARAAVMGLGDGRPPRAVALPNGFDWVEDVERPDSRCFRIVFTGWLYPYMDVRPLLAAAGRLLARSGLGSDAFRVEFMGTGDTFGGVPLTSLAKSYGLGDCFVLHPPGSRQDALRLQQHAAVLAVFGYPHALSVPTKFYDQAQMHGSMLLIGYSKGALADAAAQVGLTVHESTDTAGIDATLDAALRRWRARDFDAPTDRAQLFDRRRQSERLHELLMSLVGSAAAAVSTSR